MRPAGYRIVLRLLPDEETPERIQIVSIGPRANLEAYRVTATRRQQHCSHVLDRKFANDFVQFPLLTLGALRHGSNRAIFSRIPISTDEHTQAWAGPKHSACPVPERAFRLFACSLVPDAQSSMLAGEMP